jgi:glycosyltransferase involved in cell wall biosynthesis
MSILINSSIFSKDEELKTVEMVTYNAERFIAKAIESVLAQTCRNFELLIVDDGSSDNTRRIITSYSDDRIRYIYKQHGNPGSARNRAVAQSTGQYLLCVDSDDFIGPDYVEKIVTYAQKYPEIDYFYPAKLVLVDEFDNLLGVDWDYMDFSDNSILPAFLFANAYGPIPNPGSLIRRTLFDRVGAYEELECVEDFAFLCKNALKINFRRVEQQSTYFYRRLPMSNSQKFEARNRIMADVLNKMVSIYPAEVLCPQIASLTDAALKQQKYYEYLAKTFNKHSNGPMVRFGRYFKRYAELYKTKLLVIAAQKERSIIR